MSIYVFAVHAGWDFVNENLSKFLRFSLKSETDTQIKFQQLHTELEEPNNYIAFQKI